MRRQHLGELSFWLVGDPDMNIKTSQSADAVCASLSVVSSESDVILPNATAHDDSNTSVCIRFFVPANVFDTLLTRQVIMEESP